MPHHITYKGNIRQWTSRIGELLMSKRYGRLGRGFNEIQDIIQTTQTIQQYKKSIQEASAKRIELLVKLGEELYRKVRSKEMESRESTDKISALIELDRQIYHAQQAISEMKFQSVEGHKCPSCGSSISEDDKFCGLCGERLEAQQLEVQGETIVCRICEEQIPAMAFYCSCCGTKQANATGS